MFDFSEKDRQIFEYHDGAKPCYGDPLMLRRSLAFRMPNANHWIQESQAAEIVQDQAIAAYEQYERERVGYRDEAGNVHPPTNPELPAKPFKYEPEQETQIRAGQVAHQNLVDGIREVFDLPQWDRHANKGCTDRMVIAVWNEYQAWLKKKEPTAETTPTS